MAKKMRSVGSKAAPTFAGIQRGTPNSSTEFNPDYTVIKSELKQIEAALRKNGPKTFKVTITPPAGPTQVFADLLISGKEFHELQWLGFSSTAAANTVFYLDNLKLQQVRE